MTQQQLIVITGATGTGKTTVSRFLTQAFGIPRVVTHTTRPKRVGEVDGRDYYFETPETLAEKHLIEHVTYAGYQYGSSHEALAQAWTTTDVASIVLDTKGALTYAKALPGVVKVLFLTIEHPHQLQERLLARGDSKQSVLKRMQSPEYARDLKLPEGLTPVATVVANDDWQEAQAAIDAWVGQNWPTLVNVTE